MCFSDNHFKLYSLCVLYHYNRSSEKISVFRRSSSSRKWIILSIQGKRETNWHPSQTFLPVISCNQFIAHKCRRLLLLSRTEASDSHMQWRERGIGKSRGWEKSGEVKRNEGDLGDLVKSARKPGPGCSIVWNQLNSITMSSNKKNDLPDTVPSMWQLSIHLSVVLIAVQSGETFFYYTDSCNHHKRRSTNANNRCLIVILVHKIHPYSRCTHFRCDVLKIHSNLLLTDLLIILDFIHILLRQWWAYR